MRVCGITLSHPTILLQSKKSDDPLMNMTADELRAKYVDISLARKFRTRPCVGLCLVGRFSVKPCSRPLTRSGLSLSLRERATPLTLY